MKVKGFHVKKVGCENFVYVNVQVSNPEDMKRSKRLNFLIDTGAAGCALPKKVAEELGLQERGVVDVGLADGRSVRASATYVLLETGGKKVYTWAIVGEGFEPILGVDVMKILKIHVDVPEKQALVPLRHFKVNMIIMNNNFHMPSETKIDPSEWSDVNIPHP
ncbi:MAG: aspartyl protease family protein [Candidatus Bathyarchaeia archaeon]